MEYPQLELEKYLLKWQPETRYPLTNSDIEPLKQSELLDLADNELHELWHSLSLGYTTKEGSQILIDEIHKIYNSPQISNENISCFTGAKEAIFCSLSYLLNKDSEIITITPGYLYIETLAKFLGAKITNINLKDEDDWYLDIEELKAKITRNTKLIVLNFPHNPTGSILSEDLSLKITELASHYGIFILSVEVYKFLEYSKSYHIPSLSCIYENCLSIGSVGKIFGLSGIRISWIASQNKNLLKNIEQVRRFTSVCNSPSSEMLATIALRNKNFLIDKSMQIIQHNLQGLTEFIHKYNVYFSWHKPKAGTVVLIKYLGTQDISLLSEELVTKHGVLVIPSSYFNLRKNYFRIGFGRASFMKAIKEFSKYMEYYIQ